MTKIRDEIIAKFKKDRSIKDCYVLNEDENYLIDQIAIEKAHNKAENLPISDVSDCTIRDWIITYDDSDGTIQKAVVSGKDDDEAIANFQSDYHQEWRTIKAVV